MSRKTILVLAPLGLGAGVLLWAAMAARSEPPAAPARPVSRPAAVRPAPTPEDITSIDVPAAAAPRPVLTAPSAGGGENALIQERVRQLEEKLLSLEATRTALVGANQGLERQITEKNVDASARLMGEWKVRMWDQQLGLSETQKQSLLDLAVRWQREDAVKPAGRDTWLARESELRSRLTVEQAARLHDSAVQQSQAMWTQVSRTVCQVGGSKEDQTRLQQTLGEFRPAGAMLLPEGYGADWFGMMRDAATRLQPVLSADQAARLSRLVPK